MVECNNYKRTDSVPEAVSIPLGNLAMRRQCTTPLKINSVKVQKKHGSGKIP